MYTSILPHKKTNPLGPDIPLFTSYTSTISIPKGYTCNISELSDMQDKIKNRLLFLMNVENELNYDDIIEIERLGEQFDKTYFRGI